VHYYENEEDKKQLLKLQNGNSGFSESINKLLIITTDTKNFTKLEGNQVFIDGGMFAMSLVYALHAEGIASCCLNTCVPYVDEKKIKRIGNIPTSERLIMMVGIGKYKENFKVAISNRIATKEILKVKK
jgi:nitroreductase